MSYQLLDTRPIIFVAEDHTYFIEDDDGKTVEMPSLSRVLKKIGLAVEYDKEIHPVVLERAARRGTAIHLATSNHLQGKPWEVDPAHSSYMMHAQRLISVHKMKAEIVETPVYNPVFDYCCTPDFVGEVDGHAAIVDWKTTSRIHFQVGFQVAAQALCFREPDVFHLYAGDLKNGVLKRFGAEYLRVAKSALGVYNEVQELEEKYEQSCS